MIIESKDLYFRSIKEDDLKLIGNWQNDPEIFISTMSNRFPVSENMLCNWFEKITNEQRNKNVFFAVIEKTSEEIIGIAQLNNIDWISRTCSWGSYIGNKEKWGKGYGTQIVFLLKEYAFDFLNLRKIFGEVLFSNDAAIKYLNKIGCVKEGVLKEHYYYKNKYYDVVLMSLFRKKKERK